MQLQPIIHYSQFYSTHGENCKKYVPRTSCRRKGRYFSKYKFMTGYAYDKVNPFACDGSATRMWSDDAYLDSVLTGNTTVLDKIARGQALTHDEVILRRNAYMIKNLYAQHNAAFQNYWNRFCKSEWE